MARVPISDHLVLFWAGSEPVFGGGPATVPQAAHAIRHISADLPQPFARAVRTEDATGNRGYLPSTRGAYDPMVIRYQWPMHGPGAPVVGAPEIDAFMRAGGFVRDLGAGACTYRRSLSSAQSAWLWGAASDGSVGVMYAGIAHTDGSMPDVGTENARMEFGLQAARGSMVYATELADELDDEAEEIPLPAGHGWVIAGCPAFIRVVEGEKVEVMKVLAAGEVSAQVERAAEPEAFGAGARVEAYVPERSLPSTPPIGEIGGGFTVDDGAGAAGRQFTAASLAWQTGVDLLEKPALEAYRDGLYVRKYGEDAVTLDVDVTYTIGSEGIAYLHRHCDQGTLLAIACTVGTTAGNRLKVELPTAQVDSLDAPTSGDGPRRGTINFRGFSSDGSDLVFTWN